MFFSRKKNNWRYIFHKERNKKGGEWFHLRGTSSNICCCLSYTLLQNGHHYGVLLFSFKLSLVASFLSLKFKRIFSLEWGKEGLFVSKKKKPLKWRPFCNKIKSCIILSFCYSFGKCMYRMVNPQTSSFKGLGSLHSLSKWSARTYNNYLSLLIKTNNNFEGKVSWIIII